MINPSRPRSRTLGLLLAAVTLAAACSEPIDEAASDTGQTQAADQTTTDTQPAEQPADEDTGKTETTAEPSDEAEPADEATTGTDEAEPAEAPAGPVPAGPDTPGVTDDTVTISIIITDTSMVAQAFGWEVPDEGDREAQVEALVDHFNAAGGFAGRQIEAKVTVFNAITDGPVAEEALCNKITQDDQAFAAVLTGQFQENARPCYRNANTLMFDATLYPVDVAGFEELAPTTGRRCCLPTTTWWAAWPPLSSRRAGSPAARWA